MGADLVWIQHERPDGHRSLWVHVGRWFTIEACTTDVGGSGYVNVHIGPRGERWVCCAPRGLTREIRRLACPVPTPEDLAWVRGVK